MSGKLSFSSVSFLPHLPARPAPVRGEVDSDNISVLEDIRGPERHELGLRLADELESVKLLTKEVSHGASLEGD